MRCPGRSHTGVVRRVLLVLLNCSTRQYRKTANSGAGLSDARPDPVGGIRTGTWEGALVVGPWGDWRWGAFSYVRSPTNPGHTKAPHTLRCTGPCDVIPHHSGALPPTGGTPPATEAPPPQKPALHEAALDDARGSGDPSDNPGPRPQPPGPARQRAQAVTRSRVVRPHRRMSALLHQDGVALDHARSSVYPRDNPRPQPPGPCRSTDQPGTRSRVIRLHRQGRPPKRRPHRQMSALLHQTESRSIMPAAASTRGTTREPPAATAGPCMTAGSYASSHGGTRQAAPPPAGVSAPRPGRSRARRRPCRSGGGGRCGSRAP